MPDTNVDTDVMISELPVATAANTTDQLEVNQAGTTRSITLAQAIATGPGGGFLPLAGGTLVGGLTVATPPSVNAPVAGQNSYISNFINATGSRSGVGGWQNEFGLVVQMTAAAGGTSPLHGGKAAFLAEITATANAGQSTAYGGVTTLDPGFPVNAITSLTAEIDFNNNSGTHATDGDPHALGIWNGHMLLTGAGGYQTNFGLCVGGANTIRNGVMFSAGGCIASDVQSYSSSVSFLNDKGNHAHGFYAADATYSGSFITGPGATFTVSPTGAVTALGTTAVGAGANTQAFIKASSTTNLGIYYGTGDPTFSAAKGSLYSKTDATTTTTRLWVNHNGTTGWATLTTSV